MTIVTKQQYLNILKQLSDLKSLATLKIRDEILY